MRAFVLVFFAMAFSFSSIDAQAKDRVVPTLESFDVVIEQRGPEDYLITAEVVVLDGDSGICPWAQLMDRCERIHHIAFTTEVGEEIIFYDFYRTSGDQFRGTYTATMKTITADFGTWYFKSFAAMDDAGNELRE
jgi:hypothetical protein